MAEQTQAQDQEPLRRLRDLLPQVPSGESRVDPSTDPIENARLIAELTNKESGKKDEETGYDCPDCKNRQFFVEVDESGKAKPVPCRCVGIRENIRRIKRSGLSDLLERYTFDSWETPEVWHKNLLEAAKCFAAHPNGWFVVSGGSRRGKTHICTAICGELMKAGMETRYIRWREAAGRLKTAVNDREEYDRLLYPLVTVKVLYIDDLFKTGKGQAPTSADFGVAYDILERRLSNHGLVTLITSELSINQIAESDEAVGSRILEGVKQNECHFDLHDKGNWLLRKDTHN